jgi:hypothetical protein
MAKKKKKPTTVARKAKIRAKPAARKSLAKKAATRRVKLMDIAIARSGDKGADSNVGVMAKSPELYEFLRKQLTVERVKKHFREICLGGVDRYELPNLRALNFILHDSLGGGGTETQKTDAQGKVHGLAMLHMELDVPASLLR